VVAGLVYRLLQAGLVSRDTLALALSDSFATGTHLLLILAEQHRGIVASLDGELSRFRGPSVAGPLAIDVLQIARLPDGLCKRFLAVPLQVEPTSTRWAIAVADPFDEHVSAEISFHLGGAVDVFRAPLDAIFAAVQQTEAGKYSASAIPLLEVDDEHTPAFGTAVVKASRRPSSHWSSGENTPVERRHTPRRGLSLPPIQITESQSEPPIPLVRPIPHRSAEIGNNPRRHSEPLAPLKTARFIETLRPQAPISPSVTTPTEATTQILTDLENKQTAREILRGIGEAVSAVAKRAAVFSVHTGKFELEYIFPSDLARKFSIATNDQSLLQIACQAGYYLGSLMRGVQSDALAELLAISTDSEIYVVPVVVAERSAALIVAGLIDNTFAATRLIDHIAKRGGAVLEQLVHRRRRQR